MVCSDGAEMSQFRIFKIIGYVLLLLFLIYLLYELGKKVLGGSLGFEELVIALLIANLGYSFYMRESINKLDRKISGHIGWHKGKESKD